MKRWERARQLATLDRDPVLTGPPAHCRVDAGHGETQARIPVFIVEIFPKDLVCVKSCEDPAPAGVPGPFWLVRGGIEWSEYLPRVVVHYRLGHPVPPPFRPLRKLGGDLVSHLEALPGKSLPEVFEKMRGSGLLPQLQPLTQANCPSCLAWEQMRALFRDYKEKT